MGPGVSTKVLNLSNSTFTADEIEILKLGFSFVPTPNANISELQRDLYNFTRKLRLIFHFKDGEIENDATLISNTSNWTPKSNENVELDNIINKLNDMPLKTKKVEDNIKRLRPSLNRLISDTKNNKFIIKKADKGSIAVIMDTNDYWEMCSNHLSNKDFYQNLGNSDPSKKIEDRLNLFTNRYKNILTSKEIKCLKSKDKKMANYYMLPKIHKSKEINNEIEKMKEEYLIMKNIKVEGRPVVAGTVYHTHELSTLIHIILSPALQHIKHIIKDTFDFTNRARIDNVIGMQIGTADIKSLYTNIKHNLGLKAINFWITKLENQIPLLQRFPKNFIMEAIFIILHFNYFYINGMFFHQIQGTAMGTPAAVVYANLTVAYIEYKMFTKLPDLYPKDVVDFFIRNYYRFLDDIFFKWKNYFDISQIYELFENADPDIKFIFEELSTEQNFLDVKCKIADTQIKFDIYHKPTNSFSYLKFNSCHPSHTINNIAYSLGKRIIQIVSENKENRIEQLKNDLIHRGHPKEIIEESFQKLFSPRNHDIDDMKEMITFVHTYNPNHNFKLNTIVNCLNQINDKKLKQAFENKKIIRSTRNNYNLKQLLTRAKFDLQPLVKQPVIFGLYPCGDKRCMLHTKGYITVCQSFEFISKGKKITWYYNRKFTCSSKNAIYMLCSTNDNNNYIGQTEDLRKRSNNSKSMVRNAEKSAAYIYPLHFKNSSKGIEPYFHIFPFFYVDDDKEREFFERRFINKYRPTLNAKK